MKIVFIHQNFPAQFKHLARTFAADPRNQVVAICRQYAPGLEDPTYSRVIKRPYSPARKPTQGIHHYVYSFESGVLNGQAVGRELHTLQKQGFVPDVAVAHPGWGETLYFKDVFPDTPLINYFEFYYHAKGVDADFDPEYPISHDDELRIRTRNAVNLLSLESCDVGVSPTRWQHELFPAEFRSKIEVIHEGIDIDTVKPDRDASFVLPNGLIIDRSSEVLTYTARNLEPYRGFHSFMRAVELVNRRRPNCYVLITGGDGVSYGRRLPEGESYRQKLLKEVDINPDRVFFLGEVPYETHVNLLQISSAHVYLTYPFVLSWSMMEAMAAECVVIGSDTAPVREILQDRKTGLLVDFFSPESIADAVDEVFDHKTRLKSLGTAARKHIVKNYPLRAAQDGYTALIDRVCGMHHKATA